MINNMPSGVYERKPRGPYKTVTPRVPAEERFFSQVNKNTGSDCWHWTGYLNKGYGSIRINGKMIKAHRFSYELHKGDIPESMFILHSCDNSMCVNPEHLSVGSHEDNMRDKVNKNRQAKGSNNGNSKLTQEQVREIKNKINLGISQRQIAKEYRVSNPAINKIKTGRTWAHV